MVGHHSVKMVNAGSNPAPPAMCIDELRCTDGIRGTHVLKISAEINHIFL